MRQFTIRFAAMEDVLQFVGLCSRLPFPVTIGSDGYYVNGRSFMGLFTLDFSGPLEVKVDGTDSDAERFAREAERFLLK